MTYGEFLSEFDDVIQVFGIAHFPQPILERAFHKVKDLSAVELKEVCEWLIDNSEYAPKVPKIAEAASLVRARHREGIRGGVPIDDGPRTPEVAQQAIATITSIFKTKRVP